LDSAAAAAAAAAASRAAAPAPALAPDDSRRDSAESADPAEGAGEDGRTPRGEPGGDEALEPPPSDAPAAPAAAAAAELGPDRMACMRAMTCSALARVRSGPVASRVQKA
jgi:hypothetical protein